MDPRLFEAACKGDTNELQKLLAEDMFMLERCLVAPLAETVLHVAAMAGRGSFAKEVLRLKPELSSSLNKDGFAAIHLASASGFVDIVREILMVKQDLGHLRSSDSRTPLHLAAVTGRTEVIRELVSICPASIEDVTLRGETAIHLAVKNNQVEALKLLMELFKDSNVNNLLNAKDEDGNTVLHLATARKQGQIMKLLLGEGYLSRAAVEVNLTNKSGFTVLDLLDAVQQIVCEPGDHILRDLLLRAGALRASELIKSTVVTPQVHQNTSNVTATPQIQNHQNAFMMKISILKPAKFWKMSVKEVEQSSEGTKNALMVVVVLIATVTYQAILQPPGGFDDRVIWSLTSFPKFPTPGRSRGYCEPVFIAFNVLNSVGFFTSVGVIMVLINGFPLKWMLRLAVCSMAATYACGFCYIAPGSLLVSLTVPLPLVLVLLGDPAGFQIFLTKMMSILTYQKKKMMTILRIRCRGIAMNETQVGA